MLASNGQLPAFRVGKHWRFRRDRIEAYTKAERVKRADRAPASLATRIEVNEQYEALLAYKPRGREPTVDDTYEAMLARGGGSYRTRGRKRVVSRRTSCNWGKATMTMLDRLEGVGMLRLIGEPDREVGYSIEIYRPDIPGAPGLLGLPEVSGHLTTEIEPMTFLAYADKDAILELEDGREAEILFSGGFSHFVVNDLPDI